MWVSQSSGVLGAPGTTGRPLGKTYYTSPSRRSKHSFHPIYILLQACPACLSTSPPPSVRIMMMHSSARANSAPRMCASQSSSVLGAPGTVGRPLIKPYHTNPPRQNKHSFHPILITLQACSARLPSTPSPSARIMMIHTIHTRLWCAADVGISIK